MLQDRVAGDQAVAQGATGTPAALVVWLGDEAAADPELTGGKGAALSRATAASLPTIRGFVLTTAAVRLVDEVGLGGVESPLRAAWGELSDGGHVPLVVRSSSTGEDQAGESMAGRYESVTDVRGWDAFVEAVTTVLNSRAAVDAEHPIAVVVQRLLEPASSGVLFGVDPVTGRSDRLVASAVEGAPDKLVSGEVDATRYELDRAGNEQARTEAPQGAALSAGQLRELAELAARTGFLFRAPQDMEWAFDDHGRLWLLQSRPVTTEIAGVPHGPVLSPGPVAETFPDPLTTLEEDLWVEPLRRALYEAARLTGAVSPSYLERSPVIACVGGRVAVDLALFGERLNPPTLLERLDPRPALRRIGASWRVGRLRSALPGLARDLISGIDAQLDAVPSLDELTDRQLVALLKRAREALCALHGHEVLVGLLVDPDTPRLTASSLALRVLAHARDQGLRDEEAAAAHPAVLALVPPKIAAAVQLPTDVHPAPWRPGADETGAAVLREALRLRVRWVQELCARAAWELGVRLQEREVLASPELVRYFHLEGLEMAVRERAMPWRQEPVAPAPLSDPLPAHFRLTAKGGVVAVDTAKDEDGGTGAGGGRAAGRVHHGTDDPPPDAVLVVRTLEPALASLLPRATAIVAETGTVLSHVAILAREAGVPTVVGFPNAMDRFPQGCVISVDGTSGEVRREDFEEGQR